MDFFPTVGFGLMFTCGGEGFSIGEGDMERSEIERGEAYVMRDSQEARQRPHKPEYVGSNPTPATKDSVSAPVQPVRVGFGVK